MLDQTEPWLMEEEMLLDEPSDLLLTMPEIRQLADPRRPEEQLGLRSILECPEALSRAWRHGTHANRQHGALKVVKRDVAHALRAA